MNTQGLAGQSTAQQPQIDMEMVQQVAAMLMKGMSPEELLQQGVPQEVLQAAMELVRSQAQMQQPMAPGQEGLAGQYVQSAV